MFRLAHVTDPHFRSFDGARVGEFLGKRAVGALNVVVNRRRKHKMELLQAMHEDLRAERPDHLALTGDLSNVSLDAEWQAALRWIKGLQIGPEAITVIPGNHDAYVQEVVTSRAFERLFRPYQTREGAGGEPAADYPFLRVRGPLALVSLNSCVATGDLGAWGELGAGQLERAETLLTSAALRDSKRVVLLHHPPVRHKGGEDRNLKDRAAFAQMLARTGADLVLHGHDHKDENAVLPGPSGTMIPIVGAGSASYAGAADRRARYNIYEFDGDQITVVVRAHNESTETFQEAHRTRVA